MQLDGEVTLIGVDGGATRVRAHHVLVGCTAGKLECRLGETSSAREYPPDGFQPVPTAEQLESRRAGKVVPTPAEVDRGYAIACTIADCITEVAREAGGDRVCLGICMPGLKSPDGRGIEVINHGPRMPELADRLEDELARRGVRLDRPVHRIGSDGDYCGLGEEHAASGLFRDVDNAYYIGGGTGVAEALKLDGELVSLDHVRGWLSKAWETHSEQGPTFEQLLSASGINRRFEHRRKEECGFDRNSSEHDAGVAVFPEQAAVAGDAAGLWVMESAARALAELAWQRIASVYCGGVGQRAVGGTPVAVGQVRPGMLLERIVVGQRLGVLFGTTSLAPRFSDLVRAELSRRIQENAPAPVRQRLLVGSALAEGVVVSSRLTAAAALGAAVDAAR